MYGFLTDMGRKLFFQDAVLGTTPNIQIVITTLSKQDLTYGRSSISRSIFGCGAACLLYIHPECQTV